MAEYVPAITLRRRLRYVAAGVGAFSMLMSYSLLAESASFTSPSYDPVLVAGTTLPALLFLTTACVLMLAVALRSDAYYRVGIGMHSVVCTTWAVGFLSAILQGKASGPTGPIAWGLLAYQGFLWVGAPAKLLPMSEEEEVT